ncbi:MAG: hypothetical protein U0984_08375 [Prosthecobacter sp.]|nr:hypothetical protein [Prosthecobacter sp.]
MRLATIIAIVVVAFLAFTNPNEADFREHVRRETGIAGQFGMVVADLLSGGKKGGVSRENYLIASRFYVGGDGILPRQNVAWGIAGKFIEIKNDEGETPLHR